MASHSGAQSPRPVRPQNAPPARSSAAIRARSEILFSQKIATHCDGDAEQVAQIRNELVELHLPLVDSVAKRFSGRGERFEDLVQAGTLGLIDAVDRFDPDHGAAFSTYAIPTIVGRIKRHFRDHGAMVRIPRRVQEHRMQVSSATRDLTQQLGRSPSVKELVAATELTVEEIETAWESVHAYAPASLDARTGEGMPASVGFEDDALERVLERESIRPGMEGLSERQKRVLQMRFFESRTQAEIAAEIGVSQMQVSRILAKTLSVLRSSATSG